MHGGCGWWVGAWVGQGQVSDRLVGNRRVGQARQDEETIAERRGENTSVPGDCSHVLGKSVGRQLSAAAGSSRELSSRGFNFLMKSH